MSRSLIFTSELQPLKMTSCARVANPIPMPGKKFPIWKEIKAKWDTGAVCCFISRDLCRELALTPTNTIPVRSFSSTGEGFESIVLLDLLFDDSFIQTYCIVVDCIPGADCDMLIGMNIICQGDFSVSTDRDTEKITVSFTPYPGTLKKIT